MRLRYFLKEVLFRIALLFNLKKKRNINRFMIWQKKIKPLIIGWNLTLDGNVVILKQVAKPFIILKYDLFIED